MRATWACCPVATSWDLPPRSCPWAAGWTATDRARSSWGSSVWRWWAVWCFAGHQLRRLLAGAAAVGAGVSACLMAPLTGYRRWFTPHGAAAGQFLDADDRFDRHGGIHAARAVAAATWRGGARCSGGLAVLIVLAMGWMALAVPAWPSVSPAASPERALPSGSYAAVWRDRYFQRLAPFGFFSYGGMVAMQTLWAGPWMQNVAGQTAAQAATGPFLDQHGDAGHFLVLGHGQPLAAAPGLDANRLMAWGLPSASWCSRHYGSWARRRAPGPGPCFASASTFVSLAQPAVGMTFPQALAGRALSAYNLVIFSGVFVVQWGDRPAVDGFAPPAWVRWRPSVPPLACSWHVAAAYAWFVWRAAAIMQPPRTTS
jgi:hypothetical protein